VPQADSVPDFVDRVTLAALCGQRDFLLPREGAPLHTDGGAATLLSFKHNVVRVMVFIPRIPLHEAEYRVLCPMRQRVVDEIPIARET
jgi:hypothetical protein